MISVFLSFLEIYVYAINIDDIIISIEVIIIKTLAIIQMAIKKLCY